MIMGAGKKDIPVKDGSEYLQTILEKAEESFMVIDAAGVIRFANTIAQEEFAETTDSLIGFNFGIPAFEGVYEYQDLTPPHAARQIYIKKLVDNYFINITAVTDSPDPFLEGLAPFTSQTAVWDSQQKYRQLFRNAINGFALHEIVFNDKGEAVDFRFLDVNEAFEMHTGISREQAIGQLGTELMPGIEDSGLIERFIDVAISGVPSHFETYFVPLDRYFLFTTFSPQPNQFATVFLDVSERIRTEQVIKQSEQEFRTLVDSMSQGLIYQDSKGRIISANRAAEHILGLSFDEMKGLSSFDDNWRSIKMNGEPLLGAEHPAMLALRTGRSVEGFTFGVYNPKWKDIVWINASAIPQFREGEDEPYQVFTTFLDITDRIRVQKALEERIKELRSLSNVSRIMQEEDVLEGICQKVAPELISGFNYSELAVATIEIDGCKFSTRPEISPTPFRIGTAIQFQNEVIGRLTVFYTEDKDFILPEELNLLEGVADRLGLWVQQRRTQKELVESEQRFRNAIMNAPNPIMIYTDDMEVIDVNDAWLNLTGYTRDELQTVEDWLKLAHPDDYEWIINILRDLFVVKIENSDKVGPVRAKSGEILQWHLNSSLLGTLPDGRRAVISIGQDVTSRIRAVNEREHFYNRILALREIDRVIVSTLDLDQVLNLITRLLGNIINYDSMAILSNEGDELQVIACQGFEKPDDILKYHFPSEPGYPNYKVIEEKMPLALTNVSKQFPKFHQPGQPYLSGDIKAWLGVPLIHQHEVIGMFTIDRCSEEAFTEQDIEVAMQYANRAAIAITNAKLFAQTKEHLRRLEILRKIDGTITASKDLSDALHTTLIQVKEGLDVDVASVFLFDEDEQMLSYQQSFGYRTKGHPETKVKLGQGYVGTVAATMKPLFIPEVEWTEDGYQYPYSLEQEGVISYYGLPLISKGKLQGVLQILQRSKLEPTPDWIEFAEALAAQTAIAVDNLTLFEGLGQANKELREAYDATIEGWAHALEIRDKETEGHSRRVVKYTIDVAKAFGMTKEQMVHVWRGVLLHDIGKMGVPDHILHKPGPLDEEEWAVMRQHPVFAYEMLQSIDYLKPALTIPHYHHERWDGSGYPEGLKGDDIPLEARIFAVVDAYDALTSDRPYRDAWPEEKAQKYLQEQAGKEFDPEVVRVLLEILSNEE
jgi:PAS domain S-box-containing protein